MSSQVQQRPIVLAAGGTGGHLFPAQALADELTRRRHRVLLVTDRRGMTWRHEFANAELRHILSGTVTQRNWRSRLFGMLQLGFGTVQALAMLTAKRPRAVIGFGGYPSLPTMMAAILRRDATCLHEQNGVMGRANRLVAAHVKRIALAFPHPVGLPASLSEKAHVTGNPVRRSVIEARVAPYPELSADGPIELLVFGGSQGASVFSDVVPAAIERLPEPVRARLHVTQQAREADEERTRARYDALHVAAEVRPFFNDLPRRMASAHLVICRSGASTVCELSVIGRPAILVPLPGAIDGDQAANARLLVEAGGAWLMPQRDFSADALAAKLVQLLSQPNLLKAAAATALTQGRPDAAVALADLVTGLAASDLQPATAGEAA